jgi:DNA mismatch repair protein PMS2
VTRKSQKTADDDAGDQSSPAHISPDGISPASPLFIPSPPPQPRASPPPEDMSYHHQQPSSSKLPPAVNEGSMDVDGDDDERHSEPDEMVLDPSQTPWGRQLGISSPTRPVTPSSSKEKCSEPINDEDGCYPRKKRKSDISSVAGSGGVERATPDAEATQVVSASIDSVRDLGRKPNAKPTKLTQTHLPITATKAKNPRKNLRSQIAGFARSGSQVQPRPLSSSEDELDELDADEPSNMDEVRDEDMIKMKAVNLRPLQSSPEATSPTSDVVRDDTNTVDLPTKTLGDDSEADDDPNSVLSQALATSYEDPSITPKKNNIRRPEVIRTEKDGGDLSLRFDFDRVVSVWSKKGQRLHKLASASTESDIVEPERVPSEAGLSNTESDAKAADALARVIEKSDFESMAVVGQFNLGFIVVRRERALEGDGASAQTRCAADDLFIVDQHAADEKYNFETLQATTKIASQKLFRYFYLSFGFWCQGKLRMLFYFA